MNRLPTLLLFLSTVTAVPGMAASVPEPKFGDPQRHAKLSRAYPELERIAARWAETRGVPGLAWGVVIDGELVRTGSAGFADVEGKRPIDPDSVFRIASMTKSFTALAILMLRDEGKIELDAPASRYVSELASLAPATRDSGPITVRHLLTHTAGFPEDNPWGDRQLAVSDEQLSRWLEQGVPFSTGTGSAYEYSNYGFAILGRVVSRASGMSYREFLDKRILAPLGMRSSFWTAKDVPADRLVTAYRKEEGVLRLEMPLEDGAFGPMGGLFTSSRDLARWVAFMLAAFPPRDAPEQPPAQRRSVREMQQGAGGYPTVLSRRSAPDAPLETWALSYGYGLRVVGTCDTGLAVSHSGGLPGFGSNMIWLPEYGIGLFAMTNLTYAAPSGMLRDMLAAFGRTGGLERRKPQPAPALADTTQRLAALVDRWDDGEARALAAGNLFLDEPLARRRAAIGALREGLGACSKGLLDAENALRGKFRLTCEQGWLDVTFTLAPTTPPRVQFLQVTGGRPLSAPMRETLAQVMDAFARGPRLLDLAAGVDRTAIGALLASSRSAYGSCSAGAPLEGDGEREARIRLDCERGVLDLEIVKAGNRISALRVTPPPDALCAQ
jgi:CubicO group peptidase (beta-lactamase class C family)